MCYANAVNLEVTHKCYCPLYLCFSLILEVSCKDDHQKFELLDNQLMQLSMMIIAGLQHQKSMEPHCVKLFLGACLPLENPTLDQFYPGGFLMFCAPVQNLAAFLCPSPMPKLKKNGGNIMIRISRMKAPFK